MRICLLTATAPRYRLVIAALHAANGERVAQAQRPGRASSPTSGGVRKRVTTHRIAAAGPSAASLTPGFRHVPALGGQTPRGAPPLPGTPRNQRFCALLGEWSRAGALVGRACTATSWWPHAGCCGQSAGQRRAGGSGRAFERAFASAAGRSRSSSPRAASSRPGRLSLTSTWRCG